MAFNAWSAAGTVAGAGALSYLATQSKPKSGKQSLRMSLKDDSLLLDVRLLGGALMGLGSFWVKNRDAKTVLQVASVASLASLASTELVRYKLAKNIRGGGPTVSADKFPIFPSLNLGEKGHFGALPAPQNSRVRQGAWASR
tara:strand:+ start:868 stop:1293 length:426 start_codon:yes stop_codon:yes gene_type:complete